MGKSFRVSLAGSSGRYERSLHQLARAERVIPLATQTFSKSRLQLPVGVAPHFLDHGKAGRVWDIDGNEYVDLMAGLMPVLLGYCDPDVDAAIREQLGRGISFSLATTLETDLAERLVDLVPCAEMVRFGKNGSDVTSAAVRLARAATGRDYIIACGYHGWQDWYIGTTVRSAGVPKKVSALTRRVPFNDLESMAALFRAHQDQIAAVIMEPISNVDPIPGYLESVRDLAHEHGAVLVFDEIITGFRFSLGGAQELFGVTPDLACFGKGMGNGMPISAVVGRASLMRQFEDVFFSATFGGEALSLAATIAVIDKLRREPVIETIWRTGEVLIRGVRERVAAHQLEAFITLSGKPPWQILVFHDHPNAQKQAIQTLFIGSMLECGVLITGSHNLMYAHNESDIRQVLRAYDQTLARIADELKRPGLTQRLGCDLVSPVFSVREPY